MNVSAIKSAGVGVSLKAPTTKKLINRSVLKSQNSNLKNLCGPEEVKKAKKIVALTVAENAGLAAAMAQMPGFDEVALSANEVKMAIRIYNEVYKFSFDKTTIKSLIAGIVGKSVGKFLFKGASKCLSWIPGLGNGLNAGVAGGTTAALGALIISNAEDMDKARKNNEKLDNFFRKLEE